MFETNTAATRAFVPHIDAALVVLGGDPPISGDELALLTDVARHVQHLVFVLNKADRLSDQDRLAATEFTRTTLSRALGMAAPDVLEISAAEQLALSKPSREWARLVATLQDLAERAGAMLVAGAERRGTRLIADDLLHEIHERTQALERPIAESERRIDDLKRCVEDAVRAAHELGPLFAIEQNALSRTFSEQRQQFLRNASATGTTDLKTRLRALGPRSVGGLRREAATIAQDVSQQLVRAWLRQIEPIAEDLYRRATTRFVDLANGFLERLAHTSSPELARVVRPLEPEAGFRARSHFYHHDLLTLTRRTPVVWLSDLVRSPSAALTAVERDTGQYLLRLLDTNSSRVENDLIQRVDESRRRLEQDLQARLREVSGSAERALALARNARAKGDEAIRLELQRLDDVRRRVQAMSQSNGRSDAHG